MENLIKLSGGYYGGYVVFDGYAILETENELQKEVAAVSKNTITIKDHVYDTKLSKDLTTAELTQVK